MKLGRVTIDIGYVVDLDNEEMVQHAKNAVYDDIANAVKYYKLCYLVKTIEDPDANKEDIPEFLMED